MLANLHYLEANSLVLTGRLQVARVAAKGKLWRGSHLRCGLCLIVSCFECACAAWLVRVCFAVHDNQTKATTAAASWLTGGAGKNSEAIFFSSSSLFFL